MMKTGTGELRHYWNRLLQEAALVTGMRISKPTGAIAILTYRCNARCVHCYSYKVPRMEELTTEEWLRALDQLRAWLGPAFLSLTGGEALLRRDAIDLARHAAQLGFWVEFLSNGWLLNEEKAEQLVGSGIRRIKVSLDGGRPETHDQVRGLKGFHERASGALGKLAEYNARSGNGLQIYAKTAIMALNVDDLEGVVRFAQQIGIYGVEFQAIEPVYYSDQQGDPNWFVNNPLWIEDSRKAFQRIEALKRLKLEGYPVINSAENLSMMQEYFQDPSAEAHRVHSHDYARKRPDCRDWATGLQIDPAGNLRMCHWMEPFGNVKDGDIPRAWRNRRSCSRCGRP